MSTVLGLRRHALVALLVGLLALLLAATPSLSAPKSGKGGGGGKGGSSLVALAVGPDPAVAYVDRLEVSGCGLRPDRLTDIVIRMPEADHFFSVETDSSGCLAFSTLAGQPGDYTVDAYQLLKGKRPTHVGQGTVSVVSS